MIFQKIPMKGAFIIEMKPMRDERGFFARSFCQKEFEEQGINPRLVQANVSYNNNKGTLRGIHYQISPFEETKLVRCTQGAIFDVIIDLRKESPTYMQWFGVELNSENRTMLFVPESFGHGFQTLMDNTEVTYMVSEFYTPGSERGIRWDDPAFDIRWPVEVQVISDKDANWDDYLD